MWMMTNTNCIGPLFLLWRRWSAGFAPTCCTQRKWCTYWGPNNQPGCGFPMWPFNWRYVHGEELKSSNIIFVQESVFKAHAFVWVSGLSLWRRTTCIATLSWLHPKSNHFHFYNWFCCIILCRMNVQGCVWTSPSVSNDLFVSLTWVWDVGK